MNLDDLIPLETYNKNNNLTFRETLANALAGKIEIHHVLDGRIFIVYEPIDDTHRGKGTKNNIISDKDCIEIEYLSCDFFPITETVMRELWGNQEEKLITLLSDIAPEGFFLQKILNGSERLINESSIYVDPHSDTKLTTEKEKRSNQTEKPSSTALKVIGLLMHHLAKTPKYAAGSSPNKSQIKELLIELSDDLNINDYGLSKIDERLLTDALKYIENQNN